MNKLVFYSLCIGICCACTRADTEKYQNKRNKVVNVHDQVKEIPIEDVMIGPIARLFLIDNYLIIVDYKSDNKLIRFFDKSNFRYITSIAERGQGPDEIANIGVIGIDEADRRFYVSDHGKQVIFSYELDSVLVNPFYSPKIKGNMKRARFPSIYQYINDTLSLAVIVEPIGMENFNQLTAKWNMNTGEITPMSYKHPDITKSRINLAVSIEDSIYVEVQQYYDLLTICSLNGELKYNIYGENWSSRGELTHRYYGKVIFCKDKIVASYAAGLRLTDEYHPTKLLVFNKNGDYVQTIETGYKMYDYCYDKENDRIIMSLIDVIPFAYLDLSDIIK